MNKTIKPLVMAGCTLLASHAQTSHAQPHDYQPQSTPAFEQQVAKKTEYDTKVVGGYAIDITQAPYQVALINNSGQQFCGGTIIAKNWIVTAAHCLWGISPGKITVVAGKTYRNELKGGNSVIAIHKYPGFYDTKVGKDIALLKLGQDLDLSSNRIQAIGYVNPTDVANGDQDPGVVGTLTGWGKLSYGGSSAGQLQKVTMPIVSLADATQAFSSNYGIHSLTPDQLPTWQNNKSACHGDSGGPLVVQSNRGQLLAGVVSWGKDCDDIAPSMFARVSSFASWIQGYVGDVDQNIPPTLDITSPQSGTTFLYGEPITLSANASGNGSDLVSVSFYANSQLLHQDFASPYRFDWSQADLGPHTITVTATDSQGNSSTKSVDIAVWDNDVNQPPSIEINNPIGNQNFMQGETVNIDVTTSDVDGTVVSVAFFANDKLMATDTSEPFSHSFSADVAGDLTIVAVAEDDTGNQQPSQAVNITITQVGDTCSNISPWSASTVYPRPGNRVSYQGKQYENKWWTQGEIPSDSDQWGVWNDLGPCK